MNLRLDPWFAQLENLALVDVVIGATLLLIVTFLLSVPGTREGIPHRLFRLFGPVLVYGFATWWMIQVPPRDRAACDRTRTRRVLVPRSLTPRKPTGGLPRAVHHGRPR